MSDTTNRDIGNKREYKKHQRYCTCWHCEEASIKKRAKLDRMNRDDMKEIKKELGYSRIGRDNV